MSDETDDVLEEAADQIDAIDQALADFAEHKVHVPEAYVPDMSATIGSMSHANLLAFLETVGIETLSYQDRLMEQFLDGSIHFRVPVTVPGLLPKEEMLDRLSRVRGPHYDMVILDEASGPTWERQRERVYFPGEDRPMDLDFAEAPLFGRQDAGLDDLEPDGPIALEYEAPTFDYAEPEDEGREVLPATPGQALLQQLGRTLRACAASVSSRIPGRHS